jgi:hypothetical protein
MQQSPRLRGVALAIRDHRNKTAAGTRVSAAVRLVLADFKTEAVIPHYSGA